MFCMVGETMVTYLYARIYCLLFTKRFPEKLQYIKKRRVSSTQPFSARFLNDTNQNKYGRVGY